MDITPSQSTFLYGYPHEPRMSTGMHDPLLASALWVSNGEQSCLFISADLIWVPRHISSRARQQLSETLGLPYTHILVSATHTHSGPVTRSMLSNEADPAIPPPDAQYLKQLEAQLIEAGARAHANARPALLSSAIADSTGLGTNRRDPNGPAIPRMPLLVATDPGADRPFAIMSICAMHPTVLHEDWTWISGDFPGLGRVSLKKTYSDSLVYVHHMGASGNQSPRHVVRGNTIEEAQRLGDLLAERIAQAVSSAQALPVGEITGSNTELTLNTRNLPSVDEAQAKRDRSAAHLEELRNSNADKATTRTAECDWFGAEETLTLSRAAVNGTLAAAAAEVMPAEIQVIRIGELAFVGWPGEVFVEFALQLMEQFPHAHVITLANSDLQGYLVTQQAVGELAYEAGNAIFASPESGERYVQATSELLKQKVSTCHNTS